MNFGHQDELLSALREIVGARHVVTKERRTRGFAKGYRFGGGPVLAVVRPGSPLEQFKAYAACVKAGVIVIAQAANTGLTGGSTPFGEYDRSVVIINTMRIKGIRYLAASQQVVCLAGATLYDLERLLSPMGREPHSVIGSSCIGASVIGGICNNSGGSLVRRGPAYTELAVFARANDDGEVELINHLGLKLGDDPETILAALSSESLIASEELPNGAASSADYEAVVRDIDAASPARFNADPSKLFEASGSAGKVMVIAVRLDTFVKDDRTATFYIGTNDPDELDVLRRRVLSECTSLPVSGEYIHRDAFDIAAVYGKDVFLAIEYLGTGRLPLFFAVKNRLDAALSSIKFAPRNLTDRMLQWASALFPKHLPKRLRAYRDDYAHHLILKTSDEGIDEVQQLLDELFPSATGGYFLCSAQESQKAMLQRFAVASAAIRYRAVHSKKVGDIVALDIALRRNDRQWLEKLPQEISGSVEHALYYGHFFCHVFHQDYVLKPGVDPVEFEHRMWSLLDARGARYPAEHNVGHLYPAGEAQVEHFMHLDPHNCSNPGVGMTSRNRSWH